MFGNEPAEAAPPRNTLDCAAYDCRRLSTVSRRRKWPVPTRPPYFNS